MNVYSEEEKAFIYENYQGISNRQLTLLFNKNFNKNLSEFALSSFKSNRKLKSGISSQFKKGAMPHNKGKKQKSIGRMAEYQFNKGHVPLNYREIGSERILADGYTQIKIFDPGIWITKHRYIWELHNGDLPKGYLVIFLNGDKTDFDKNNLIAVTRSELMQLNKLGYIQSNSEITKAGINIIRIKEKLKGGEEE